MIKVLELFGGYGSQALALENLGIDFKSDLCEIDKYAIQAYNQLHGETFNYGDICSIDETKLPYYDLITYSSPCFTSDTLVLTDSWYKEIYDIEVGFDKVLTHTNTYKTVKDIFMNGVKDIVSIRCIGVDEIKCTPNHKFFARKRSKKYSKRKLFYVFSEPEWIEAKDLTKDTYLGISINSESEIPKWDGIDIGWSDGRKTRHKNELSNLMGNNDFWWVVGRYMGDGWLNKNGGIKICCAKDELEEIRKHLNRLPFKYCVVEERTVYKVQLPKKEIGLFFEQFGRGANNKHLTKSVFNLPEDLLKCFLDGYFSADGCFYKKQGMIACCSVSRELIYGIAQCCAKVYKRPYRIYKNKRPSKTTIEGRIVNQMDDYTFRMKLVKNKKEQAFYENGFIWTPFKERKSAGKEYVYDLEVEEDHSFTAQNVIVHNCQDFSQAGKQAGGEKGSGTRSSLLWECERIIRTVKPKYLLMENVKALTSKKFMPLFANWLRTLENMGYKNWWKVLNAKDYGVPQNRERVFVVSIFGGRQYQFPEPIPLTRRLKDILEQQVDEKYYISNKYFEKINIQEPVACASRGRNPDNPSDRTTGSPTEQRIEINTNGTSNTLTTVQKDNYVIEPKVMQEPMNLYPNSGNPQAGRVYNSSGISPAMDTCQGGNRMPKITEQYIIRKLTPRECWRLMGVKDEQFDKLLEKKKFIMEGDNLCNVKFVDVTEKQKQSDTGTYVCFTIKDLLGTETPIPTRIQKEIEIEKNKNVKFAIEKLADVGHLGIATNIIKCTENGEMLCTLMDELDQHKMAIIELGKEGKQNTEKFLKITLEENCFQKKLYITLILIALITKLKIYTFIKAKASIQSNIVITEDSLGNMTLKILSLEMGYISQKISSSQLYKLAGNSIVVDVLMGIFKNMFEPTEQKGQLELL